MNALTPELTTLLLATFFAAGLVKGVTGMGLPTVAMGLLGTTLSPLAAAAMLVLPSFVTNVWQLLAGPHKLRLTRRFWPMMLGIVLGTAFGSTLLVAANPTGSGRALGCALIAYACYALLVPPRAVPPRLESWLAPAVGLLTGVITGATGVFVMPAVPWLQSLRLGKDELVQALGLSFTVSTIALAGGLLAHGALRVEQLGLSSLAIVPALAGMWAGQKLRDKISPRVFRRGFLLFLIVLGLELAVRPFA